MKKILFIATFLLWIPTSVFASSDYSFANFRGANYMEGHYWFGNAKDSDVQDAEISATAAQKMNVNLIRINVRMNSLAIDVPDDIFVARLTDVVQVFAKRNLKVILVLGGYVGYDTQCNGYGSFLDVQKRATKVITAFKGRSELFAWELLNEALSGNDKLCQKEQIIKAVNAMYSLVRSIDPTTPTTVSEVFYWWDLPTWKTISTFASFHWYPFEEITTSPVTDAQISKVKSDFTDALMRAQTALFPMPLIISEFGIQSPSTVTEADQAKVYQAIYDVLKSKNIGGAFWTISVNDASGNYSIIKPDGSFKEAAYIVQSQYANYAPSSNPTPTSTPTPTIAQKPGDLNGDGKVDIFDYNLLIGNFGKTGTNLLGDIDKNGKVDIFDYNSLIANFGK